MPLSFKVALSGVIELLAAVLETVSDCAPEGAEKLLDSCFGSGLAAGTVAAWNLNGSIL